MPVPAIHMWMWDCTESSGSCRWNVSKAQYTSASRELSAMACGHEMKDCATGRTPERAELKAQGAARLNSTVLILFFLLAQGTLVPCTQIKCMCLQCTAPHPGELQSNSWQS